jgi:hypothetical protein
MRWLLRAFGSTYAVEIVKLQTAQTRANQVTCRSDVFAHCRRPTAHSAARAAETTADLCKAIVDHLKLPGIQPADRIDLSQEMSRRSGSIATPRPHRCAAGRVFTWSRACRQLQGTQRRLHCARVMGNAPSRFPAESRSGGTCRSTKRFATARKTTAIYPTQWSIGSYATTPRGSPKGTLGLVQCCENLHCKHAGFRRHHADSSGGSLCISSALRAHRRLAVPPASCCECSGYRQTSCPRRLC